MTEFTPTSYIVTYDSIIYGVGHDRDSAYTDAVVTLKEEYVEQYGEEFLNISPDSEFDVKCQLLKTSPATDVLVEYVIEHGGDISWFYIHGVASLFSHETKTVDE